MEEGTLTPLSRRLFGDLNSPDTTPPTVPVVEPTFLQSRTSSQSLRATWLGHACYYVEFPSGLRVLFDPVFEERCSPFSFFGPKRYTKPPCYIKDIPVVDAIVISHSHYGVFPLGAKTAMTANNWPRSSFSSYSARASQESSECTILCWPGAEEVVCQYGHTQCRRNGLVERRRLHAI